MAKLSESRVLVTGSHGFFGTHLCNALKSRVSKIVTFDLSRGQDITSLDKIMRLPKVDSVFHLAAYMFIPKAFSEPQQTYRINIGGTLNILEYCRQKDVARIIYPSSYVYGRPEYLPVDEKHPTQPNNPYTQSKLMGEELCESFSRDYGISCVIFRIFNIYGPYQKEPFLIPTILSQLGSGKISLKDPKPRRDFLYIKDMTDACVKALKYRTRFDVFNIGSGRSHSVSDIVDRLVGIHNKDVQVSYTSERRKGEILDTVANINKIKRKLKWTPEVDLDKGLRSTYREWMKREGVR